MSRVNAALLGAFLWVVTSNRKVGLGVPVAYAARTIEDARASCVEVACALLVLPNGKRGPCYSWSGTDRMAFGGMIRKAEQDPGRYTLPSVLDRVPRGVRIGRISAIADPGGSNTPETLASCATLTRAGLIPLVFSHGWRREDTQALRPWALASCETPQQALKAARAGWAVALMAPWDRPYQGVENWGPGWPGLAFDCPAQLSSHRELRKVTCDDCRRCSPRWPGWVVNGGPFALVLFRDHGPSVRPKLRAAKKARRLALAVTS